MDQKANHQAIPVDDCGEPLVDIRREGGLAWGPPPERPETEPDYCWLRKGVYERLLRVEASLPRGLHLRIYEGFRSLATQRWLFDEEKKRVAAQHPRLSAAEIHERATNLVAPVVHFDGTPNLPPHSTGGAVDLEIVDEQGRVIDFGMEVKDWTRVPEAFCETRHDRLADAARANRGLLCAAMEEQGFANYWREWWHYSFGDRYWAWKTGKARAIYASVEHRPAEYRG